LRADEPSRTGEVTRLLGRINDGDSEAASQLYELVYPDLQRMARSHMRTQPGHTLRTVGLVSEVYLRLAAQHRIQWQDRHHFIAVAGRAMRHVLVDHARRKNRLKRGGDRVQVLLDHILEAYTDRACDILDLEEALCKLGELDAQALEIVEMRFFCGLGVQEIADLRGLSSRTVDRIWKHARAWLHRCLSL